ncbi:unnamed protein product [Camellia sinensis]
MIFYCILSKLLILFHLELGDYRSSTNRSIDQFIARPRFRSMDSEAEFADHTPSFDRVPNYFNRWTIKDVIKDTEVKGFNPGLIVLLLVGGLLLTFLIGNYVLYIYAQKTLPPKKKKPISKKKMRKERLKQGVSAPGE